LCAEVAAFSQACVADLDYLERIDVMLINLDNMSLVTREQLKMWKVLRSNLVIKKDWRIVIVVVTVLIVVVQLGLGGC
jgi:hypothetical protein